MPKFTMPEVSKRAEILAARRNLKMASSAHAYVRGSTIKFYEWLEERGSRAVPAGPPVWICGDCHVGNLGPLADAEGKIHVQIRDLDQSVIGNPNHDLIRLALSLFSAARGSDLPGVTAAHMLESMMEGYEQALRNPSSSSLTDEKPESVRVVMRRAARRTWKHLAKERLKDVTPKIPRGERYWPLSTQEDAAIAALFEEDAVHALITSLNVRSEKAKIRLLDSAYWMKGCSSLGKLRFAALLEIRSTKDKEVKHCLIDIKEAVAAVAPRAKKAPMPSDNAQRVVEGAKSLSPALGERMLPARLLDRSVFLRELLPQDLKLEIDKLTREEAVSAARYLAGVVGKAHARQMDAATRNEFRRSLKMRRSRRLDAPPWLWSSVVDLAATHEAAYLEHCRTYALAG
jgi:uncharacterized protein (DUF2252 family)